MRMTSNRPSCRSGAMARRSRIEVILPRANSHLRATQVELAGNDGQSRKGRRRTRSARVPSPISGRHTPPPSAFSRPSPLVALAWASRSTNSTRRPCAARQAARFTDVVVLPTPPFWLATASTGTGVRGSLRWEGVGLKAQNDSPTAKQVWIRLSVPAGRPQRKQGRQHRRRPRCFRVSLERYLPFDPLILWQRALPASASAAAARLPRFGLRGLCQRRPGQLGQRIAALHPRASDRSAHIGMKPAVRPRVRQSVNRLPNGSSACRGARRAAS